MICTVFRYPVVTVEISKRIVGEEKQDCRAIVSEKIVRGAFTRIPEIDMHIVKFIGNSGRDLPAIIGSVYTTSFSLRRGTNGEIFQCWIQQKS